MYETVYIGKTQQTFKKTMDGHLSNLLYLLKNVRRSDWFATHFEQNLNYTMYHTDLCKYTAFKLVKQIKPINAMKNSRNQAAIHGYRNI